MKRRPDWRTRLHEAVEAARREPFSWETGNDCAMFAANCVLAMTGEDPAARYRGRYTTAHGALRVVREAGFADLADAAADLLEEIHPSQARVGDVAMVPVDDALGWSVGVVIGEQVAVLTPTGIGSASRSLATKAFRVP